MLFSVALLFQRVPLTVMTAFSPQHQKKQNANHQAAVPDMCL